MMRLFLVTAGFFAWAAQFTVVYGATSLACFRGFADVTLDGVGVVPATIAAATLVALTVTGMVIVVALARWRRLAKGPDAAHFLNVSTILVSGLAVVAIVWTGLPALILPACA